MRLRSGLGAGLVVVAVVVAVAVLRPHSLPTNLPTGASDSQPAPVPVVDARSRELTADFRHTTLLPATVRFADYPTSGFVFYRYVDTQVNHDLPRYTADGLLVRAKDNAVLDRVEVTLWRTDGRTFNAADLAKCDRSTHFIGPSCTQQSFPHGVLAKVVRNPSFAQTMASDATAGWPSHLQTELQAAYPGGTLLTITVDSVDGAGIPLDDAAMLRLATIPGIVTAR